MFVACKILVFLGLLKSLIRITNCYAISPTRSKALKNTKQHIKKAYEDPEGFWEEVAENFYLEKEMGHCIKLEFYRTKNRMV